MEEKLEFWSCTIGPIDRNGVPFGGDFPLREAVQGKFIEMFGEEASKCSSGWGLNLLVESVISQILRLETTDPSGKTLEKIIDALDENTKRLKEEGW
jgi:hypothetical protein